MTSIFFVLVVIAATCTAMVVSELTKNSNATYWTAAAVTTGLSSIIFAMSAVHEEKK